MPYSLARHPFPPATRQLRLARRTVLASTPSEAYVRVRLVEARPGELAGFVAPGGGDHVRVVVAPDGGAVSVDDAGAPLGESRTETVVDHSVDDGYLDLDVLVRVGPAGSELGVIGAWAARAPLGSPAVVMGPKGSVVLSGAPGEVVLAGDDSALPAVRRYIRMLGPSITGHLLLETRFDGAVVNPEALGIDVPPGLRVSILEPDSVASSGAPSAALAAALQSLPAPVDPLERFVFACGEQSLVAPARAMLAQWGIDVERAVVKGYWKR